MVLRPVLFALVLVLAATADAHSATRQRDKCNREQRRTVALTAQIRVYERFDAYHACVRATGKATMLFESDGIYNSGVVRAVAGRFVAYEASHVPECKADCPPGVTGSDVTEVADARNGVSRVLRDGSVGTLLLRDSGSVAWLSGTRPDADLTIWRLGRKRVLVDSGDISGVRLAGGTLAWSNAGERHAMAFA
jgi:hypothetical protein